MSAPYWIRSAGPQSNMHHTAFAASSAAPAAVTGKAVASNQDSSLRDAIFRTVSSTKGHNTDLRATVTQHRLGTNAVAYQAMLLDLPS